MEVPISGVIPNARPDQELVRDIEKLLVDVRSGHVRSIAAFYMGTGGFKGHLISVDPDDDSATVLGGAIASLLSKLIALARSEYDEG